VNGYSGFYPASYGPLALAISDVPRHGDAALDALQDAGATHVIVHEGAYLDDEGARFSAWLAGHGAAEVARRGRDLLFELPH
jgi:hypothetical protein